MGPIPSPDQTNCKIAGKPKELWSMFEVFFGGVEDMWVHFWMGFWRVCGGVFKKFLRVM